MKRTFIEFVHKNHLDKNAKHDSDPNSQLFLCDYCLLFASSNVLRQNSTLQRELCDIGTVRYRTRTCLERDLHNVQVFFKSMKIESGRKIFHLHLSQKPSGHHHELVHSPAVNAKPFSPHREEEALHEEKGCLLAPKAVCTETF